MKPLIALISLGTLAPVASAQVTATQEAKLLANELSAFDFFGGDVDVDGDTAVIGANHVDALAQDAGAAYVYVRQGNTWLLQATLLASDGSAFDYFGNRVAIDGDTIVVGARGDDDQGSDSGSAYVFVRSGTIWNQQAKLLASNGSTGDWFGKEVAIDGDRVAVGAPRRGADEGGAYVFSRSGTVWSEETALIATAPQIDAEFGCSLAIDGDWLLAGAQIEDVTAINDGAVHVFARVGSSWVPTQTLTAFDATTQRKFGFDVALDGDTALIGSPAFSFTPVSGGSAYVYRLVGLTWTLEAQLAPIIGATTDHFGKAVDVKADTLAVAASSSFVTGAARGSASVYTRVGTSWSLEQALTPTQLAAGDLFGSAVALSGDTLLGGSVLDVFDDQSVGSANTFTRSGTTWTQEHEFLRPADEAGSQYGTSVAAGVNRVFVGAWRSGASGFIDGGAVYVYELDGEVWRQSARIFPGDASAGKSFGYSVTSEGDALLVGAPGDSSFAGAAYRFEFDGTSWNETVKFWNPSPNLDDQYGTSVDITGDRVLIGAPKAHTPVAVDAGAVYAYTYDGLIWLLGEELYATDGEAGDLFGTSLSGNGTRLVIGAPGDDDAGSGAGAAYIYLGGFSSYGTPQKLIAPDAAAGDSFGHSVVSSSDRTLIGAPNDDTPLLNSGSVHAYRLEVGTWVHTSRLTDPAGAFNAKLGWSVSLFADIAVAGSHLDGGGTARVWRRSGVSWTPVLDLAGAEVQSGDWFGWSVSANHDQIVVGARHDDSAGFESGAAYVFGVEVGPFREFCFGDGGDQLGCTDCPCSNNAPQGTRGGCLNSNGTSARLEPSGDPSVANDTFRVEVRSANPNTFAILTSGLAAAPANTSNPCFGLDSGVLSVAFDGLRCVVQSTQRHGSRATDANGDIGVTTNAWGAPSGPAGGLLAHGGYSSGQTIHWYVTYREDSQLSCMTGQSSTNGVTIRITP